MGFDGGYTYFASEGFTPGTIPANWIGIKDLLLEMGQLDFIPSFGPGYNDTLVRPWNAENLKEYVVEMYIRKFQSGIHMPNGVMITSFNEWGEGTFL